MIGQLDIRSLFPAQHLELGIDFEVVCFNCFGIYDENSFLDSDEIYLLSQIDILQ